jgi:hypothetical protein
VAETPKEVKVKADLSQLKATMESISKTIGETFSGLAVPFQEMSKSLATKPTPITPEMIAAAFDVPPDLIGIPPTAPLTLGEEWQDALANQGQPQVTHGVAETIYDSATETDSWPPGGSYTLHSWGKNWADPDSTPLADIQDAIEFYKNVSLTVSMDEINPDLVKMLAGDQLSLDLVPQPGPLQLGDLLHGPDGVLQVWNGGQWIPVKEPETLFEDTPPAYPAAYGWWCTFHGCHFQEDPGDLVGCESGGHLRPATSAEHKRMLLKKTAA